MQKIRLTQCDVSGSLEEVSCRLCAFEGFRQDDVSCCYTVYLVNYLKTEIELTVSTENGFTLVSYENCVGVKLKNGGFGRMPGSY